MRNTTNTNTNTKYTVLVTHCQTLLAQWVHLTNHAAGHSSEHVRLKVTAARARGAANKIGDKPSCGSWSSASFPIADVCMNSKTRGRMSCLIGALTQSPRGSGRRSAWGPERTCRCTRIARDAARGVWSTLRVCGFDSCPRKPSDLIRCISHHSGR
jgi:hypothetical protein